MKLLCFNIKGINYPVLLTNIDCLSKCCDVYVCEHIIEDVPFSKIRETVENFLK